MMVSVKFTGLWKIYTKKYLEGYKVIQTGLAMTDITVAYCRVCKNELVPSDITTICDNCLFSLSEREIDG